LANLRDGWQDPVFDPPAGRALVLVIAYYRKIRALEFELNKNAGEPLARTDNSPDNYHGIELRDFSARSRGWALIHSGIQCDVRLSKKKEALGRIPAAGRAELGITCGNALRWTGCRSARYGHGGEVFPGR